MKPEHKKIVLEALRSGKFKQHRQAICDVSKESNRAPEAYCCLGVMDVSIHGDLSLNQFGKYDTNASVGMLELNEKLLGEAGIEYLTSKGIDRAESYMVPSLALSGIFISLNDSYKWDFNQIADFAEVVL